MLAIHRKNSTFDKVRCERFSSTTWLQSQLQSPRTRVASRARRALSAFVMEFDNTAPTATATAIAAAVATLEDEPPAALAHAAAPPVQTPLSAHEQQPPLDPRILANVVNSYEGETLRAPHCDVPVYHGTGRLVFRTGFVYTGDFFLGRMHGKGRIEWASGVVYDGDFVDNEMRGKGSYAWPNGSCYTGDIVAGKRHGRGVFVTGRTGVPSLAVAAVDDLDARGVADTYGNEVRSTGTLPSESLLSSPLDPPLLFTFHERDDTASGRLDSDRDDCDGAVAAIVGQSNARYEGEWRDGLPHGDGVLVYDDASNVRYEGQFVRGKRDGSGQMRYASGNLYVGQWRDDVKRGFGVMKWMGPPLSLDARESRRDADTDVLHEVYEGQWLDDCQHGFGRHVWLHTRQKEKNYYEGEFRAGLRHGLGIFYYANGARYEGAWRENVKDGIGTFFYEDGRVFHGAFRHDRCVESAAAHMMETAGIASSASNSSGANAARILLYVDALLPSSPSLVPEVLHASGSAPATASTVASDAKRDKSKKAVEHAALRLNTELRALYRHYTKDAQASGANDESVFIMETFESRKLLAECGVHITSGHLEQLVFEIRSAQRQSALEKARAAEVVSTSASAGGSGSTSDSVLSFTEQLQRKNTLPSDSCAGIVPHDQLLLYREFVELLVRIAHWRRVTEQGGEDAGPCSLADAFTSLYDQMMCDRLDAQQQAASWLGELRRHLLAKETHLVLRKHSARLHRLFCDCSGARSQQSVDSDAVSDNNGESALARESVAAAVSVRSVLSLLRHVKTSGPEVFDGSFRIRDALAALEQVFGSPAPASVQQPHTQVLVETESGSGGGDSDGASSELAQQQQKQKQSAELVVEPFFGDTLLVYSEFVDALAVVLYAKQQKSPAAPQEPHTPPDEHRHDHHASTSQQQQQQRQHMQQHTHEQLPLHVLLDQFLQNVQVPSGYCST